MRLDEVNNQFQISFSVDRKQRGEGIGNQIISFILKKFPEKIFLAKVSIDSISKKGNKTITHYIKEASDGNY